MCPLTALWYDGQPCDPLLQTADICDQQRRPKRLAEGSAPLQGVLDEDKVSPDSHFLWRELGAHDHLDTVLTTSSDELVTIDLLACTRETAAGRE